MTLEPVDRAIEPAAPRIPPPLERERAARITNFEQGWRAVLELRPKHKLALKEHTALKQHHDGQVCACEQCGKVLGFKELQIHHIDHNERNNQLSNLRVFCIECNNNEHAEYLKQKHTAAHVVSEPLLNPKEKENNRIADADQERLIKQAPWTTQLRIRYKRQALDYLLEYVTKATLLDNVVADIVALTECSKAKALEYLDDYSNSPRFSPFRKWLGAENEEDGTRAEWIAPRTIEDGAKPHPVYAKAIEDYRNRKGVAV